MNSETGEIAAPATSTTTTTTIDNVNTSLSVDERQLAEMIAEKQSKMIQSSENIIVNNFVGFFEPLIQNLDLNVQNLR